MKKHHAIIGMVGTVLLVAGFSYFLFDGSSRDIGKVISDDGNVTLAIPKNVLPQGISTEDIRIKKLDYDAVPGKPSREDFIAAYEFQPDGLEFRKPIEVSFVLKNFAGASVPTVDIASKNQIAPLTNQRVKIDAGSKTAFLSGEISHFSQAILRKSFFAVQINGPGDHFVGDTFDVEVIHSIEKRMYVSTDDQFITRTRALIGNPEVRGKIGAWVHAVPEAAFPKIAEAVSPGSMDYFPPITAIPEGGELKTTAIFTCVKPGSVEFIYESTIAAEVEYHQIPKPQPAAQVTGLPPHREILSQGKSYDDFTFLLSPFSCLDGATEPPLPAIQVGEPVQEITQRQRTGNETTPPATVVTPERSSGTILVCGLPGGPACPKK